MRLDWYAVVSLRSLLVRALPTELTARKKSSIFYLLFRNNVFYITITLFHLATKIVNFRKKNAKKLF
ncbi:hypothetical protein J6TS2_31040 [Heyndrickxia sporothermodurans]|nr:hypothetical protein J6TS2_31040 [Heyndrickxia sporothermodurans]